MSAQRLAAFCLLNLVPFLWGDSHEAPASPLVVYLSADPGQSPRVLAYMQRELGQLMQTAGYEVQWRDPHSPYASQTSAPLIVARLSGHCALSAGDTPAAVSDKQALASTPVADGRVLPFSTVHCDNLTHTLEPLLAAEPGARRDFLYGRAIARVLAHEFYHILLGATTHAAAGVAKPCFTPIDLVTERFEFEHSTLARLQKHPDPSTEPTLTDDATGRD